MDELFDFHCWVGSYELRLPNEPSEPLWMAAPFPRLHLTGPAKRVRPRREALDKVVDLLAGLKMPKLERDSREWGERFGYGEETADMVRRQLRDGTPRGVEPDPEEFAALGRIVSAASKQIGMLGWQDVGPPEIGHSECLNNWIVLAWNIQLVFQAPRISNGPAKVGDLGVFLVNAPKSGTAISIRPSDANAAVIYHAARMVAAGTAFQTCAQCRTPFLAGGMRGKKKKRAGSRFCSDQCRWDFNNARLAKRRRPAAARA